jgi:hypothetical protein
MADPPPDTVKIKVDLIGSSLTRGVSSLWYDRAVRRCRVLGLTNDPTGIKTVDLANAVDRAIIDHGGTYPSIDDGLPLRDVRAYKYGKNRAWVTMRYQRNRWSLDPIAPAFETARFQMAYERTPVFRVPGAENKFTSRGGLPDGPWYATADELNKEKRPLAYMWSRPVVKIAVHTVLSFHPYSATLFNLQGKINDSGITFGNYLFQKFSVRYDGTDVDWSPLASDVSGQPGSAYPSVHMFTAARAGWYNQYLIWEDTPPLIGNWRTNISLAYDTGDFVDAFPVNDPVPPPPPP